MSKRFAPWMAIVVSALPLVVASQTPPANEPTSEQVFKSIVSFKGVPAKDIIPSMEFMSAALKYECSDCHNPKDYAASTERKDTAREMIAMQRDINAKFFRGRNEVTCMSCHNGKEHPTSTPIPQGTTLRHRRIQDAVKPEVLLEKHTKSVGSVPAAIRFVGIQTPPFGPAKERGEPVEMVQAADGRFAITAASGKFGSDGKQVWRDGAALTDEPAAIFGRMGRSWRGDHAFEGLEKLSVSGSETLDKTPTTVVRGTRAGTGATEELYFDNKSGLLARFVSVTRSTLGSVVTVYDYSQYKSVKGVQVPMTVTITYAAGDKWVLKFASATASDKVDDSIFAVPAAP